jgi:hypothetical protein
LAKLPPQEVGGGYKQAPKEGREAGATPLASGRWPPVLKPSILRTHKRRRGKPRKSGSCIGGISEGFRNSRSRATPGSCADRWVGLLHIRRATPCNPFTAETRVRAQLPRLGDRFPRSASRTDMRSSARVPPTVPPRHWRERACLNSLRCCPMRGGTFSLRRVAHD